MVTTRQSSSSVARRQTDYFNDHELPPTGVVISILWNAGETYSSLCDQIVEAVYSYNGYNKVQTSKKLGLSLSTVRRAIKRMGTDERRQESAGD
jgi:DNA-binding NtrC family response regulator